MRNFLTAILMVFSLSTCVKAQVDNDSLYYSMISRSLIGKNFLRHNLTSADTFGQIELNYSSQSGALKPVQVPYKRQNISFYAIGANEIGRFRLSGDFLFNKIYDDSLSYAQKNLEDLYSPYYYYASKSGKYERQNYRSNLSLSYRLSNRFRPFVRVAHLYHWSTGSVDPRLDDKRFDLKLQPGIIFYVKNANLALSGIYGKGNERMSVEYKNKNYSQSLVFPDRIHYLSLGYGYNGIKDTAGMRKYNSYRGFELSYHQDWDGKMLDVLGSYTDREEKFTTDRRATSKKYITRGIYNEATIKFEANLNMLGRRSNNYLCFYSERIEGSDLLSDLSSNLSKSNYQVSAWTNRLTYIKETKKLRKVNYQVGLGLEHYFLNRQDHASGIDVSNNVIKTSLTLGLIVKRNYEEKWVINFSPNFQIPISDKLTYSENALNNFIRDVIFWDYNYLNTSNYGTDFRAEFISKRIVKNYNLGVFGGWKYQRGKVNGYLNRQQYEIGMRMYL